MITESLRLSGREVEIIKGIFDDLREADISAELGISPHTVHTHIERLHRKLEVASRVGLVIRVFQQHLLLSSSASSPKSVAS